MSVLEAKNVFPDDEDDYLRSRIEEMRTHFFPREELELTAPLQLEKPLQPPIISQKHILFDAGRAALLSTDGREEDTFERSQAKRMSEPEDDAGNLGGFMPWDSNTYRGHSR